MGVKFASAFCSFHSRALTSSIARPLMLVTVECFETEGAGPEEGPLARIGGDDAAAAVHSDAVEVSAINAAAAHAKFKSKAVDAKTAGWLYICSESERLI